MERYFQYLLSDLEALAKAAPKPLTKVRLPFDEEEDILEIPLRQVKIGDLLGLQTEVFPPEHLLTDLQVLTLIEAICDLWSAWHLRWDMPANLPARKHYNALVREFNGAPVSYHPEDGADVHICDFTAGKSCPFLPGSTRCKCRDMEDSALQDLVLWEEYVHSLGLDPDADLTAEEEAHFDEEIRRRRAMKDRRKEDLLQTDPDYRKILQANLSDEEQKEYLFALQMADEILDMILNNIADDFLANNDDDEDFDDFEEPDKYDGNNEYDLDPDGQ